jgi:hypothetical protein
LIRERKADLVIADAFALASADAAINMKIPVALTSTFTTFPGKKKKGKSINKITNINYSCG